MKWLILVAVVSLGISCKKNPSGTQITLPIIQSGTISEITLNSITLSGKIDSDGGSAVTEAGFVIDTNHSPSLSKNLIKIISEVDASGNISGSVSSLKAATNYFVRVYARNSSGEAYSEEVSFSTLDLKTYNGDVALTTQQEVVTFAANHYNRINGELVIYGEVTDVSSLSDIVEVVKELRISNTSHLKSLNGLQNIKAVNTAKGQFGLNVSHNEMLESLKGLEGISHTYGTVLITKNYEITSLEGLDNLKSIEEGKFTIDDCDKITNLHGLENLQTVGQFLHIGNNDLLTDLSALSTLSSTKGLGIFSNEILENINGLSSLTDLIGLSIAWNPNLSDISGLHLESLITLQIESNKMTSLAGLENIESLEALQISDMPTLTDISALANLKNIQNIQIRETGLVDLKGLYGLTSLTSFSLYNNNQLQSLEGLDNLNTIEYQLNIVDNPSLTEFCALKLLSGSNSIFTFTNQNNGSNPTRQEILSNCP